MKKVLYIAMLLFICTSLVACIGDDKPPVTTTDTPVSSDTLPPITTTTAEPVVTTAEPPVTTETAEPPVTVTVPAETTAEPPVTVAPKPVITEVTTEVTTEATEFDFAKSDLSEYILLGTYRGMEVQIATPEKVSEAAIEESIENALADLPPEARIYTRACIRGDKVNIDFAGSMSNDIFEGGRLTDYTLLLGENATIPGFDDKILGMIPGDVLTFTLTFPDDYYGGLGGKQATFEVKLNYIYPTLTDAIAVQYLGATSAADYRAKVRQGFENEIAAQFAADKEAAAWTKALANSMILQYPEKIVAETFAANVAVYTAFAEMNSMTYEELFSAFYGLTVEDAEQIMLESSKNIVAQQLLLYAIARDLGLDVSDERFEEDLAATAAILGLGSVDELIEQLGGTRESLKEDKLYAQVIAVIMEDATFVLTEAYTAPDAYFNYNSNDIKENFHVLP